MAEPFIVHRPASWSKLRKLVKKAASKVGFEVRYRTECGKTVALPPTVELRKDDRGSYFVAGPHPNYFAKCEECAAA